MGSCMPRIRGGYWVAVTGGLSGIASLPNVRPQASPGQRHRHGCLTMTVAGRRPPGPSPGSGRHCNDHYCRVEHRHRNRQCRREPKHHLRRCLLRIRVLTQSCSRREWGCPPSASGTWEGPGVAYPGGLCPCLRPRKCSRTSIDSEDDPCVRACITESNTRSYFKRFAWSGDPGVISGHNY